MKDTKIVKAFCPRTKRHFALELLQVDGEWKVVDLLELSEEEFKVIRSEVTQDRFYTNSTLQACYDCGSRLVGGCDHAKGRARGGCHSQMPYHFMCVYCKELKLDYTSPNPNDVREYLKKHGKDGKIKIMQGKEYKPVTFTNVTWKKFDNVGYHEPAPMYPEPKLHVEISQKAIKFNGYNISEMNEGVYYEIGMQDDFDISCKVDTSTIRPHPGGHLYIELGIIRAEIALSGGQFKLDGATVASVGSRFKMRLSLTEGGKYRIYIDDKLMGEKFSPSKANITVRFGFTHGGHHCKELSRATLSDIEMVQGVE